MFEKRKNNNVAITHFVGGRDNTPQVRFPRVVIPEYIVNFETNPTTYHGEFGFDWFRKEWKGSDNPCTEGLEELKKVYTPFEIGVKHVNTGEPYGSYYVPWLVMFSRSTVKLLLVADMDYNNCNNSETETLSIISEDSSIRVFPDILKLYECLNGGAEITISCDEPVVSDTSIVVKSSSGAIVGKLNILANAECECYRLDIPVVYACIKDNPSYGEVTLLSRISSMGGLQTIENYLNNNSFNQALIQVKFVYDTDGLPFKLSFSEEELCLANEGKNIKTGKEDYNYAKFKNMWNKDTKKFKPEQIKNFFHYQFGEIIPKQLDYENDIFLYITPVLASQTEEEVCSASKENSSYSKVAVVFGNNLNNLPIYVHELGHTLGLSHIF